MIEQLPNLWVDDLREPPEGWHWAKTSADAIQMLKDNKYCLASFDHDLGGDDTTRPAILWLCENNSQWPMRCFVHTQNPVGKIWLEGMISYYQV